MNLRETARLPRLKGLLGLGIYEEDGMDHRVEDRETVSLKLCDQNKLTTFKCLSPSHCRKPTFHSPRHAMAEGRGVLPWDAHTSFASLFKPGDSDTSEGPVVRGDLSPCHSYESSVEGAIVPRG